MTQGTKPSIYTRPRITSFGSKESYVAWRKIWRDAYAALSEEIREKKKLRDNLQISGQRADSVQSEIIWVKVKAREMLIDREESKLVAKQEAEDAFAAKKREFKAALVAE